MKKSQKNSKKRKKIFLQKSEKNAKKFSAKIRKKRKNQKKRKKNFCKNSKKSQKNFLQKFEKTPKKISQKSEKTQKNFSAKIRKKLQNYENMCAESFFQVDLSFEDFLIESANEADSFHVLVLGVLIVPEQPEGVYDDSSHYGDHDDNDENREEVIEEKPL